ncbi:Hydrogenase/urease nickel incorporation protein HypA [Planctomycetes bacterium Pan216]|uniref:Hydrogenase maturation factor HypA n=1 Tax=Kolteria novifilia TaxID=2527975 RepID=A0A518BBP7_9BACT|nr:Hydrogenase/urease nickel incorporation protein HypA [Planctomycetes bacterium Pan216]
MHELSIATSLIDVACDAAGDEGAERVLSLRVRLGPLAGVDHEALLFAFGFAAEGTMCEGARLLIEEVPVTVYCPDCDAVKRLPEIYQFTCPDCGTPTPEMRTGREMELASLEIDSHEAAHS